MLQSHSDRPPVAARLGLLAAVLLASAAPVAAQPSDDPNEDPPAPSEIDFGDPAAVVFFMAPWGLPQVTWETNTSFTPFQTLDQARREVRRYIQAVQGPRSIQVRIAGGLYPLSGPVVFEAQDSGWPGNPIMYVGWNLLGPGGIPSGDDVLFSGGVVLKDWEPVDPNDPNEDDYRCHIPADVPDVRDLWVNNQRMIRARFPNVPPLCTAPYTASGVPPCPNTGTLVATRVQAVRPEVAPGIFESRQRITVRTPDGSSFPTGIDWSHVEASATRIYTNSHQRVSAASVIPGQPDRASLDFTLTPWPAVLPRQHLGGLGCFYYNNWDPANYEPTENLTRGYLQLCGELDVTSPTPGLPVRARPAQMFLTGALAFLDTQREWHFDPDSRWLYLKLCAQPGTEGYSAVVPIAQELLVLRHTQHVEFHGLDWAYTHQPLPRQADGVTPGYTDVQAGLVWDDTVMGANRNNIVSAAVTMLGAQDCRLMRCRIAHTGGSGAVITTDNEGIELWAVESNRCRLEVCEIFDIGGHGVYLGDEWDDADATWALPGSEAADRRDPSNGLTVQQCRIQNFSVNFRDSVGIYIGHTRDVSVVDNEISYGNYDGISVGTYQAHYQLVPDQNGEVPPTCGQINTNPTRRNTEGTKINRNDIHRVMLKLTDGGAIYMPGSHIPSNARPFSGELALNYIHDIVLNPNLTPAAYGTFNQHCKAFYFEQGSDGWWVWGNYSARVQAPYSFSTTTRFSDCTVLPAIVNCPPANQNPSVRWWAAAWPSPWVDAHQCNVDPFPWYIYEIPGQNWKPGSPNYWLDQPGGAYDDYRLCTGYAGAGGMASLTGPNLGNRLVADPALPPNQAPIAAVIAGAGPDAPYLGFFFSYPSNVRRIHRTPICGGAVDPASQVQ